MGHKIGLILLVLGPILLGTTAVRFGLVTDAKELPLLKRWLFWLRGGGTFWNQRQREEVILEHDKGIRRKRRWRTEKTPIVIGIILTLLGLALSL